jgi:hypothetical protein
MCAFEHCGCIQVLFLLNFNNFHRVLGITSIFYGLPVTVATQNSLIDLYIHFAVFALTLARKTD